MYTVKKTAFGAYTAYVLADTSAGTTATIVPEKGGMLTSFTKDGQEYIWLREPNFSLPERPRCAVPVLFPACGRSPEAGNLFGGKSYPMDIHGVVHSKPWQFVGADTSDSACVTVRIESDDETRASYPFDFSVTLTYVLDGTALTVLQSYANRGSADLPFNFGFHPYFVISDVRNLTFSVNADTLADPAAGTQQPAPAAVDFPYDENETIRYYQGVHSPMAFTDSALERTVAVYFDEHFKNGVLWSQCPLGFVCVEPWNGFPGSLAAPQHETLAPGECMDAELSIVVL
ncbi:MAG: aldose epimerase [Ruthenibacterium sp.]